MSEAVPSPDTPVTVGVIDDQRDGAAPMRLYVCTTCRDRLGNPGARPGVRLHAALAAAPRDPLIEIVAVECLSVCKMNVAVSFAAAGKWTYVYGVPSDTEAATIFDVARLYAKAPAGLIPWAQRPEIFKKGVVARVPPTPVAAP